MVPGDESLDTQPNYCIACHHAWNAMQSKDKHLMTEVHAVRQVSSSWKLNSGLFDHRTSLCSSYINYC